MNQTPNSATPFDLSGWTRQDPAHWRKGAAELTIGAPGGAARIGSRTEAVFRDLVRDEVLRRGGGLVAADLFARGAARLGRVIAKFPQNPSGMTFEGWLVFARGESEHLLTVRFPEASTTGVRDTAVFLLWEKDRPADADPSSGWMADPYDPARRDPLMRNGADDERYDAKFPEHPLSLLRVELRRIENALPP